MLSKFLFGKKAQAENEPSPDFSPQPVFSEDRTEVVDVDVSAIICNPFQPRKTFSEERLTELASSIREFGIIQPLIVRRVEEGYELIAGERRLRAAVLAGLKFVPCLLRNSEDKETAEIAMIENLQREDLHFFEEAAGYERLLSYFSFTQEALSARVGKTQSTIANKLRLLKLSPKVREGTYQSGLSERHARALLSIENEADQLKICQLVVEKRLTVKDTENLIKTIDCDKAADQATKRRPMVRIVKDVRIFINTMGELVKQMKKTGLAVEMNQEQNEDTITITMRVPKRR